MSVRRALVSRLPSLIVLPSEVAWKAPLSMQLPRGGLSISGVRYNSAMATTQGTQGITPQSTFLLRDSVNVSACHP